MLFAFSRYSRERLPTDPGVEGGIYVNDVVNSTERIGPDYVVGAAPPQPGDFDEDGDVDGGDFLLWQRGGSPSPQNH